MTTDLASVLVPLDGSETAEAALPYAEAIARTFGTGLRLLSVVDRKWTTMLNPSHAIHTHLERMGRQRFEEYLATTAANMGGRGVSALYAVAEGDPPEEILAAAEASSTGMIVMATHGHGRFDRSVIGGIADKVIRTGTHPLLLVQPPDTQDSGRTLRLRKLMVPLDGSQPAEAALAAAADIALASGAGITLVRVEQFLSYWLTGFESLPDTDSAEENITQSGIEYLDRAKALLPEDVQVDTLLLRGGVDANLIEYARHQNVDLVVMTTHGHGGLRERITGSTTDRLIRSGAPVLLIRPSDQGGR